MRILAPVLPILALAACSPSPLPSPDVTPTRLEQVCSHVDRGLVAEVLGADVPGTDQPTAAVGQWGDGRSCLFSRDGAQLSIGLGPVPRPATDAGLALAAELGLTHPPANASSTVGVGDLAVYDPLRFETADGEGIDRTLQLVAVRRRPTGYDAVFISGQDPTPDRHVLGHTSQDQLTVIARNCLASLS
jgi:hypothetical protein